MSGAAASAARSRAVARAWRASPAWRRLAATFAPPAADAAAVAAAAARLLRDDAWLAALMAPLVDELAGDPWFDPPLTVKRDPLRTAAVLFDNPLATVSVSSVSARALRDLPPPATVVFGGRLAVTRYLRAGGARLARWAAPPVPDPLRAAAMGRARRLPDATPRDGGLVRHDGRVRAQAILAATDDVVTLTATVRLGADPVGREYDAASGAFVRMATTDEGAARSQVLLSLLRATGAAGAAACFDAATRDGAFFLRWSAMREWLAHDRRGAWPRLAAMAAGDPHPDVRAAAAATLTRFADRRAA